MCMCGDPYCWSCGPAQGYEFCVCGLLTDECETPAACERLAKDIEAEQGFRDELRASGERPAKLDQHGIDREAADATAAALLVAMAKGEQ